MSLFAPEPMWKGLALVAPSYDLMYTLARTPSQSIKLEG